MCFQCFKQEKILKSFKVIVTTGLLLCSFQVSAAPYCGNLKNAFGPFDYRKANTEFLFAKQLVEPAHFTEEVENLIKGSSGYIGSDLDYTLRAFPNHHRALASIAKYSLRSKANTAQGLRWSFDCYFERAMRFQPDDDIVHMIYGTYQYKKGNTPAALEHLQSAVDLNPENAASNYNLGLVFLQQKNYDQALVFAKKAYSLDYPVQGLKTKLIEAGKWTGP